MAISLALKPIKFEFEEVKLWVLLFDLELQVRIANTGYKIQSLSNSENITASETIKIYSRV